MNFSISTYSPTTLTDTSLGGLLFVTFTGKERDEETGYSYFGARYYDADLLTVWLSIDPMADKYPSISAYTYCAWNPVKLVDPDGQDIWLVNKNGERIKYQVGMSNEGLDKYTSETILALNRLVQTKTIGLSIFQLSNTTYVSLEIIESEETSAYIGVDDRFIMDNYPIINFNPYLGIMSCKTNEILSPAACLGHELGHIFNEIESPKDFYMRRQTFCDDGWSQMEDFYTITNWEHGIANEWKELCRNAHNTISPEGEEIYKIIITKGSTTTEIE